MTAKPTGKFKPGQKVPASGQIKTPGAGTEKTVVAGEKFPPTSKPGQSYVYTDVTKHKK